MLLDLHIVRIFTDYFHITYYLFLLVMNICDDIYCQYEKQKHLFGCTPTTNIEPDSVYDVKGVGYLAEKSAVCSLSQLLLVSLLKQTE